jgi:hypothetical protein
MSKATSSRASQPSKLYENQIDALLAGREAQLHEHVLVSFSLKNCPELPKPSPLWQRPLNDSHVDFLAGELAKDLRQ